MYPPAYPTYPQPVHPTHPSPTVRAPTLTLNPCPFNHSPALLDEIRDALSVRLTDTDDKVRAAACAAAAEAARGAGGKAAAALVEAAAARIRDKKAPVRQAAVKRRGLLLVPCFSPAACCASHSPRLPAALRLSLPLPALAAA